MAEVVPGVARRTLRGHERRRGMDVTRGRRRHEPAGPSGRPWAVGVGGWLEQRRQRRRLARVRLLLGEVRMRRAHEAAERRLLADEIAWQYLDRRERRTPLGSRPGRPRPLRRGAQLRRMHRRLGRAAASRLFWWGWRRERRVQVPHERQHRLAHRASRPSAGPDRPIGP